MLEIVIKIPGQPDAPIKLPPGVYKVGSNDSAHIQLPLPGISNQHCHFIVQNDILKVMDTNSSNGTFVDGVRLGAETTEVNSGSVICVGNVQIAVIGPEVPLEPVAVQQDITAKQREANPETVATLSASLKQVKKSDDPNNIPILDISGIPRSARPFVQEVKKRAHIELLKRLNLKRLVLSGISETDLENEAKNKIREILSDLSVPLPPGVPLKKIENELIHEAIGLGPLEDLIAMTDITEIMVNGPDNVYVEHKGVLYKTDMAFADSHQVLAAIERIVSPLGRRIDESSPMVDARLKDGSRVNAIIPPLSLIGPSITIRKFAKTPLTVDNLVQFGSISYEIAHFLDVCVKLRKNLIISGGTGSGKTTLLNILSSYLPNRERIVTIEDAAELQLRQDHVVRLESRPPNIEGRGEINIRDLVRNSLRMRPDRIVIGECRGGEALDMLQAMNTGHDGSLTTIHANTPRDALSRLETLVLMAGFDLPLRAIREQIASAITIIVQINREKDGTRKVTCVSEIVKMEGEIITMQDLFVYKQDGWDADGKMTGKHVPTGSVPTFMEEIKRAGLELDIAMFSTPRSNRGGFL